jgi:DNA-binding CsgD family transcriptional regulator
LARELVTKLAEDRALPLIAFRETEETVDCEIDDLPFRISVQLVTSQPVATTLSPREGEIAEMVAQGHTNHAIATVLGISTWTVSTHLRRVFAKLGVNSRAAMVAGVLTDSALGPRTRRTPK